MFSSGPSVFFKFFFTSLFRVFTTGLWQRLALILVIVGDSWQWFMKETWWSAHTSTPASTTGLTNDIVTWIESRHSQCQPKAAFTLKALPTSSVARQIKSLSLIAATLLTHKELTHIFARSLFNCLPWLRSNGSDFRLPASLLCTYNGQVCSGELRANVSSGCMLPHGGGMSSVSSTVSWRSCAWMTAAAILQAERCQV